MKILMLVPFLPNREMSGGQTRWYNLITHLSKTHDITLLSLIKDDWEKKFIPELEKYCKKVLVFKRSKSPWTFRNLFLTAISFYPLVVIRNLSLDERKAIQKELETEDYDLIHAETFYVMPHIPRTKRPIILVEPTIEFSVYQHFVNNEVPLLLRPIYMVDIVKLRFWEKYYWKRADKVMAVSEEDKKVMENEVPGLTVDVIPNGIDSAYFNDKKIEKKSPPRILYVGNYKWMQNIEAVDILIKEIWPKIKKRMKKVKLWIVGVNMPDSIIHLAKKDKDIEVTEAVKDIREAYKGSSVLVAPIKGPGGTRLKVLEALASGLPVVSTKVGVAGLELTPGKHALVADTPEGLVEMAAEVLEDNEFAARIGAQGKEFVGENFDWKGIAGKLNSIYKALLKNHGRK